LDDSPEPRRLPSSRACPATFRTPGIDHTAVQTRRSNAHIRRRQGLCVAIGHGAPRTPWKLTIAGGVWSGTENADERTLKHGHQLLRDGRVRRRPATVSGTYWDSACRGAGLTGTCSYPWPCLGLVAE